MLRVICLGVKGLSGTGVAVIEPHPLGHPTASLGIGQLPSYRSSPSSFGNRTTTFRQAFGPPLGLQLAEIVEKLLSH
jgi:hypothetical protein